MGGDSYCHGREHGRRYVRVVGVKVGADMQEALDDDLQRNVLAAALEAILR